MGWFIIALVYNEHNLQTSPCPYTHADTHTLGQIWAKAGEKLEDINWAVLTEVISLTSILWIEIQVNQINRRKSFMICDITLKLLIVNQYMGCGKFPNSILLYNTSSIFISLEGSFIIFFYFPKPSLSSK